MKSRKATCINRSYVELIDDDSSPHECVEQERQRHHGYSIGAITSTKCQQHQECSAECVIVCMQYVMKISESFKLTYLEKSWVSLCSLCWANDVVLWSQRKVRQTFPLPSYPCMAGRSGNHSEIIGKSMHLQKCVASEFQQERHHGWNSQTVKISSVLEFLCKHIHKHSCICFLMGNIWKVNHFLQTDIGIKGYEVDTSAAFINLSN